MHATSSPLWKAVKMVVSSAGRAAAGAWPATANPAATDWCASALGPAGMGNERKALMIFGP